MFFIGESREMGVGAAAQVVVQGAVAAGGDRGGGHLAFRGEGEGEPGSLGGRGSGRSRRRRRSSARRHRCGASSARRRRGSRRAGLALVSGPGIRRDLIAAAEVSADLLAVAHPALRRQSRIGDLDDVALGGARPAASRSRRWRMKSADQPGRREVDRRRIERTHRRAAVEARVAVGGDRVALGSRRRSGARSAARAAPPRRPRCAACG